MPRYAISAALLALGMLAAAPSSAAPAKERAAQPTSPAGADAANWGLVEKYCSDCHNSEEWEGGVAFDALDAQRIPNDAETWEKVVEKLRGRLMPPPGSDQPGQKSVDNFVSWVETRIDTAAAGKPHPGHVSLHRLNRTEYARAVSELLNIDVDAPALLPKETRNEGFDNIANVLKVSPSFLDQYLWAAREVSVQAVGDATATPMPTLYRAGPDDQRFHVEGLPLGTRGGMQVEHVFPADGEYLLNLGVNAGFGGYASNDTTTTVVMTLDGAKVWELQIGGADEQKYLDQQQVEARKALAPRFRNIKLKVPAGATGSASRSSRARSPKPTTRCSLSPSQVARIAWHAWAPSRSRR